VNNYSLYRTHSSSVT